MGRFQLVLTSDIALAKMRLFKLVFFLTLKSKNFSIKESDRNDSKRQGTRRGWPEDIRWMLITARCGYVIPQSKRM